MSSAISEFGTTRAQDTLRASLHRNIKVPHSLSSDWNRMVRELAYSFISSFNYIVATVFLAFVGMLFSSTVAM